MAKKHGFAAALVLQTVIGAAPLLAEATTAVDGYKPTEKANAAKNDADTANNPLTVIPSVLLQNYVQPILRAVVPLQAFGGSNLLRLSLPVASSVWNSNGATTGIGDLADIGVGHGNGNWGRRLP